MVHPINVTLLKIVSAQLLIVFSGILADKSFSTLYKYRRFFLIMLVIFLPIIS